MDTPEATQWLQSPDGMRWRGIEAKKLQIANENLILTGNRNGHAEWRPLVAGFYTLCGITPEGRYLIAKNAIGISRYDEYSGDNRGPFYTAWSRANCDATSPRQQGAILREVKRIREEESDKAFLFALAPSSQECLNSEHAAAGTPAYHLGTNRYYCKDGSYESDQAAARKTAASTNP